MRDRSGLSGRRLGSQKLGTACGAASGAGFAIFCACAPPLARAQDSRTPTDNPIIATSARSFRSNLAFGAVLGCIAGGFLYKLTGLLTLPAGTPKSFWEEILS